MDFGAIISGKHDDHHIEEKMTGGVNDDDQNATWERL